MNNQSTTTETTKKVQKFNVILSSFDGKFLVEDAATGYYIRNAKGDVRRFSTRNSARKAITRQRSGDFHR